MTQSIPLSSIIFWLWLIGSISSSSVHTEPIDVHLGIRGGVEAVHLECEVQPGEKGAAELERTLSFDLDHNGYTALIAKDRNRSRRLLAAGLEGAARAALATAKRGYRYLVYARLREGRCEICYADLDSGRQGRLRDLPITGNGAEDRARLHAAMRVIHQRWFGDPGITCAKLLFARKTGAKRGEIWECDYDGRSARAITAEGSLALMPASAQAGTLYVSYKAGQPRIYYLASRDSRPIRVCNLQGNQFMPAFNKQRNLVALICDHLGHPELYLQPLDSSQGAKPAFRRPRGVQASPTFSPDGRRIALVSNRDGSPRIYVAELGNRSLGENRLQLISRANRENTAPSWSPDGTKLAYSSREGGIRQIWIFDFHSQREWPLTTGPTHKENPSWAPDSAHLIYNTVDGERAELYLIELRRRSPFKLDLGPGEKRFGSWRPGV